RERRALHLVEVEGVSYRVAAEDLMIKLENLKMVIFRARRKIHRAMRRVFDGLPHDCRPAREPRSAHELLMEDEQGVDARSTPTERGDAGAPSDPRSATGRPIEYEADE